MVRRKQGGPENVLAVYDAERWLDRYTILLNPQVWPATPPRYPMLALSADPDSPQGVSQFSEGVRGRHLGKRIGFHDLPSHVRAHVIKRLSNERIPVPAEEETP